MQRLLLGSVGAAVALTLFLVILAGCGGGGPINTPNQPGNTISPSQQFLALLPAGQRSATNVGNSQCATCHNSATSGKSAARTAAAVAAVHKSRAGGETSADPIDFDAYSHTKHGQTGVNCEQCHGPGSAHITWATGFLANNNGQTADQAGVDNTILTYPNITEPAVCAQCHGPIVDQWSASMHAQVVEDAINSVVNAANPASAVQTGCASLRCHSANFRAEMISYPLSVGATPADVEAGISALTSAQVVAKGQASKHTATCGSCHNPHKLTGVLTQKVGQSPEEHQIIYHPFRDPSDPSLLAQILPPGNINAQVEKTIDHACGTCHNGRSVDPSAAGVKRTVVRQNFHEGPQLHMLIGQGGYEGSSGGPLRRFTTHASGNTAQCVQCHMPESNGFASHTMTVQFDTSCSPCHSVSDAASRASALKAEITNDLVALRNRMVAWATTSPLTANTPSNVPRANMWEYVTNVTDVNGRALDAATTAQVTAIENTYPASAPGIMFARHNYHFILQDKSLGIHNSAYTRYLIDVANQELDKLGVSRAPSGRAVQTNPALYERTLQWDIAVARRGSRLPGALQ